MPTYIYKAKKGPGEVVKGEIEADSEDHAVGKLERMELVPVTVVEKGGTEKEGPIPESRTPGIRSVGIRTRDIDIFTRQLASLVRASVPILRTLSLISQQTENRALKNVVNDLKEQVKDGRVLSEALERYPRLFNNLYLSMVKSGERVGALDEVLYKLTEHREKEEELRRKILAAMAYPLLVIVVGIATIFAVLTFFLPKLTGLFESMRQTLPMPTKILIGMSEFMSGNWHWFLIALVFVIAIFGRVKTGSKKKFLFDMIKLHMPFVRKFVKNAEIARFARTLALLLKSGLPVHESLHLATDTLDNDVLRERLRQAGREIVNQGSALSNSLKKINIFPDFAINMIAVGEEGGRLEGSLSEIANVYEKEVEQAIKIMTSLLEPLLILAVGVVVGFIVFAMLLPIFNIG